MRSLGAILLVAAAAGFAAWRIARPPSAPPTKSVRPAWTGARVDTADGVTLVRLAGSPREKGLGHGTRLRERIRALFEAVQPKDEGLAALAIETGGKRFAERLPTAYAEEIEGIAEGCGLTFEQVLYLNSRFDLRAFELAGGDADSIGFGEAAAVGAGPEVVRRFHPTDLDGRAAELVVFVSLDDEPLVLVGFPGMVGGFLGVRGTADRVGGTLRPVQGAVTPALTGLPWPLFLRRLLEQPAAPGDPLPALATIDASIPFVRGGGEMGTLDVSPRGATWHPAPGDFAVAHPEPMAGESTIVREQELDPSRRTLRSERARRVMAGRPAGHLVSVRLRAGSEGVRIAIRRDGLRFARSIRYRD